MTPRGGPLSENGKVLLVAVLFPIFWPFIPVLLICMVRDAVRQKLDGPLWRVSCWRRGTCPNCNWPKMECVCDRLNKE